MKTIETAVNLKGLHFERPRTASRHVRSAYSRVYVSAEQSAAASTGRIIDNATNMAYNSDSKHRIRGWRSRPKAADMGLSRFPVRRTHHV
jgi:hypothetical protein